MNYQTDELQDWAESLAEELLVEATIEIELSEVIDDLAY